MNRSERMLNAMDLASRCWSKATHAAPSFVENYFSHCEALLLSKPVVTGDEFRSFCNEMLLFLPNNLHHNTWVSGVNALQEIGWIEPITKVEPVQSHNHMDTVTLWRSKIYGDEPVPFSPVQVDLFK